MKSADRSKPETHDRSMAEPTAQNGDLFFFPKRKPPVSVRASSLDQARHAVGEEDEAVAVDPALPEETNPPQA